MNKPTIYLDMDGVVADWRANAIRVIGYDCFDPKQRYDADDWAELRSDPHIFLNLPLMPRAEELVAIAREYRDRLGWELLFLTAIPHNNDVPWAFYDKIQWVKQYFPDIAVHFGPYSDNKSQHCSAGDILVDDRWDNCNMWTEAGGLSFRVGRTLDATIEQLQVDLQARIDHAMNTRRLIVEVL
jgi:5'(3')-deoxyribonucleotidase